MHRHKYLWEIEIRGETEDGRKDESRRNNLVRCRKFQSLRPVHLLLDACLMVGRQTSP
jgi:hypothetical protein